MRQRLTQRSRLSRGVIDFLVKREYLKVAESAPATEKCNCGHCGIKGYCAGPGRMYVVTEKGKKLANGNAPANEPEIWSGI